MALMPQLFATKSLLSSLNDGHYWDKKEEEKEEEEEEVGNRMLRVWSLVKGNHRPKRLYYCHF